MTATERVAELRVALDDAGAAGFVTIDPDQQVRLIGFRALIYSRPIILFVGLDEVTLIVPELEERHARAQARVDSVLSYGERPRREAADSHRGLLQRLLDRLPRNSSLAIDEERTPVALERFIRSRDLQVLDFERQIRRLTEIKRLAEIDAIRRASEFVLLGVSTSLAACRPGVSELEIDGAGDQAILSSVSGLEADTTVELLTWTPSGPERTLLPHAFSAARRLQRGDSIIHSRQVAIDGYRSELERTAFIGEPDVRQTRAFDVMLAAQQAAMDLLRPGVRADEVDRAARKVIDDHGFGSHMPHRTGHGIAVSVHEQPHLRFDNSQALEPGMVVTIEPGFYVPGLGGFRHSDTFVITERGRGHLTDFPRSLDEMVLAA